MKPALSVAVGINHLFHAEFLGYSCKPALFFQDVCGRLVQKHDVLPITGCFGRFEGTAQPSDLPLHQLSRVYLRLLIPADDSNSCVEIERAFKGVAFRPHQGIVVIGGKIILQEKQCSSLMYVQLFRL